MSAVQLFHEDGTPAGVWYCSECRRGLKTQEQAESCCEPRTCQRCGGDTQKYFAVCSVCQRRERDEKAAAKLAAAELVPDYDGWVWANGRGHNDGFFQDIDELLDHLMDYPDEDRPEFVHCCRPRQLAVDLSDILERLDENGWEEMTEHASGVDEFSKAIDAFNEANADTFTVWEIDTKRKVAVPTLAEAT